MLFFLPKCSFSTTLAALSPLSVIFIMDSTMDLCHKLCADVNFREVLKWWGRCRLLISTYFKGQAGQLSLHIRWLLVFKKNKTKKQTTICASLVWSKECQAFTYPTRASVVSLCQLSNLRVLGLFVQLPVLTCQGQFGHTDDI